MGEHSGNEVTRILARVRDGEDDASSELWPLVYDELRRLAESKMRREQGAMTLQPTALVHEAYLRLIGHDDDFDWDSRAHFFGAAATAMRRILIEHARRQMRLKRGAGRKRESLSRVVVTGDRESVDLLDLHAALEKLEAIDEEKSALVTLRYLLGCTIDETARALRVSPAKVKKDWTFARAWLQRELHGSDLESPDE